MLNTFLTPYSKSSRVFDDYGLQLGNKKICYDTHHTTGAFSNIKLIADEIIWAGNDEVGFHTSHRTIIRGRNDGKSNYGPATNKDIDVLVIAKCVAWKTGFFWNMYATTLPVCFFNWGWILTVWHQNSYLLHR
ncbi:MAG: hypothetical protein CM1200mP30_14560 [Pseudomonadota bacterium]|nr:MAG: hypothetical protein CM1200mP30_14560 [Pseudomonadota bacterium]